MPKDFSDQYYALSAYFLQLVKNEYDSATYRHLRKPSNNAGKQAGLSELRPKFKVFARSPYLLRTNMRNLDLGANEIIIEVKKPLVDSLDYRLGVLPGKGLLRLCSGSNISGNQELYESLTSNFRMNKPILNDALQEGDFHYFIQKSMMTINDTLHWYKVSMRMPSQPFV